MSQHCPPNFFTKLVHLLAQFSCSVNCGWAHRHHRMETIPKRTGFFSLSLSPTALAHLLPLSLCARCSDKSSVLCQCHLILHSAQDRSAVQRGCCGVVQKRCSKASHQCSAAPECGCIYEIHFTLWLAKWMQPIRLNKWPWSRKTTWCAKPIIQQKSKKIYKRNYYIFTMLSVQHTINNWLHTRGCRTSAPLGSFHAIHPSFRSKNSKRWGG